MDTETRMSMQVAPPFMLKLNADPLEADARATIRGDEVGARALLVAVTPAVTLTVERVIGRGDADRDDVVQEALLALLRSLADFRFECSVNHYAKRVALRVATTTLRNRRAQRRSSEATTLDPMIGEHAESPEKEPFHVAQEQRRLALFRQLLTDLPPVQREAIALKVLLGHSVAEIATITASNINAVRSRLHTARETMRSRIAVEAQFAELREEER